MLTAMTDTQEITPHQASETNITAGRSVNAAAPASCERGHQKTPHQSASALHLLAENLLLGRDAHHGAPTSSTNAKLKLRLVMGFSTGISHFLLRTRYRHLPWKATTFSSLSSGSSST